jgi:SAM-dependent methyltransferase
VIEHVQDPVRCIAEMVRVLKPGGWLFIFTPDYRHTYEQHYKKHLPIWAPMWLIKLWLRWQGRPASFFDSIQRVNSWQISRILQEHPVTSFYVVPAWTEAQKKDRTWGGRLERWLTRRFGFQRNQRWLVRKEGGA